MQTGSADAAALVLQRLATPIGRLTLVADGARLVAAEFADVEQRLHAVLRRHYAGAEPVEGVVDAGIIAAFDGYFDGCLERLASIPVAVAGTPFQRRVWAALRALPPGQTTSYGAMASSLGLGRAAARAVGHANGANPIAVVIPCHRLVGANGSLTGYAGGLYRKDWLLAHEGARIARGWRSGQADD